jgi:uncharacterized membrane protein YphA (DoxX/SURF4 family)
LPGLVFLVFGLNAFFNFIPALPYHKQQVNGWAVLVPADLSFLFMKITEIALGIALLTGYFVPLRWSY